MRILIVASKFPPEYTGPGVRIPRLYNAIGKELGVEHIDVLTSGIEHTKNEDYDFEGMKVHRRTCDGVLKFLPFRLKYFIDTLIADKFFKNYNKKPDLVHVIGHSGTTAAALNWAGVNNVPVLIELVTAEALPAQRHYFSKITPHQNSKVIVLTKKVGQACIAMGFPADQIWQRPNPIDEEIYQPPAPEEKEKLRRELTPFATDDIIINSVAKMMPQKNQKLLVEALAHLPENFKLLLGGPLIKEGALYARDKAYVDEIKSIIETHNLENRVHIVLDFVNSADYMKASDIYGLPAWNEGFGTPMIEAIACGLPVIANKNEIAFQEWIADSADGYLCDITSPEDWADAIQKAVKFNEAQRREQSQKIHSAAGQKMIYNTYVEIMNELTNA